MADEDITLWEAFKLWIGEHSVDLIIAAVIIVFGFLLLFILRRQLNKLRLKDKLTKKYSKTITRISSWIIFSIMVVSILLIFDITVGAVTGIVALFGGTIIGFAAINTIGNAIAGIIVMTSKPFKIGDRILYKETIADVVEIELMYTKLKTLDNAMIFIPNQELINREIKNLSAYETIRQSVVISVDYNESPEKVQKLLLASADMVVNISKVTTSVSIKTFQNNAVEYALSYDISDIKKMFTIDSTLKYNILLLAKKEKIDLRTPILSQSLSSTKGN